MNQNSRKYILSIDLGTSGSKTAIVSVYGEVVDFDFESVPLILLPDGGAEQKPDDWWHAIMMTSKRLLSKGTVNPDDIVAIAASTQWAGTVPVDQAGKPLMNAIIWMDMRGAKYVAKMAGGPIKIEGYNPFKLLRWIRMTGGAPALTGKDPVGHILLIRNEFPDLYQKTYKFLEPKDYINFCFTGKFAASYDSITLHWVTDNRDISHITYSDKLLEMYLLEKEKLSDLKRSIDILGPLKKEVARELGLKENVQVVMGSPDVQTAALGSGAVRDKQGHIYEDNSARACIYNLSLKNARADIVRAFLEGVAYNQRWALQYVEKFVGRPMNPIHMVGGGAISDVWCQIHADVLNRTIKQVKDPIQTNARGAAFIAAVGLGYMAFEDIPKYIQINNTFEPNPENRKIYDQFFAEFLNIYKHNKAIFKRLNSTN